MLKTKPLLIVPEKILKSMFGRCWGSYHQGMQRLFSKICIYNYKYNSH